MNKKNLLPNILFGFCLLLFSPKTQSQSLDELANQADQLIMTNIDSSLILYQQLEQLALEKNDKKAYAYAIINSAGVCNHKHRYEEARKICLRGLTKQPFPRDSFEIIMTLGQSYDQDDIQMADPLFKEAEKIVFTLNDSTLFTGVYLGLGNTSFSKGSFYESLDYYFKCLELSKSPKDSFRRSGLLVSLSRIFLELGNLNLAEKYITEGLHIMDKNNYKKRYYRTSVVLANLLLKKGEIEAAQNEITSTRNWLMENNRYGYRSSNANTQASIFIIQKKWDEAEASLIQAFEEWKNMKSTDNILVLINLM